MTEWAVLLCTQREDRTGGKGDRTEGMGDRRSRAPSSTSLG